METSRVTQDMKGTRMHHPIMAFKAVHLRESIFCDSVSSKGKVRIRRAEWWGGDDAILRLGPFVAEG